MNQETETACDIDTSYLGQKASWLTRFFAEFTMTRWVVCDICVACFAIYFGCLGLHFNGFLSPRIFISQLLFLVIWSVISGVIASAYDNDTLVKFWKLIFSIFAMNVLSILGLSLFTNLVLYEKIGRIVLFKIAVILLLGSGGLRLFVYATLRYFKINVLLVGNERMKDFIAKKIEDLGGRYALAGYCDGDTSATNGALGSFNDVPFICQKFNVHLIVISDRYIRLPHVFDKCLLSTKNGCRLLDESMFFERAFDTVLIDRIDPSWFYTSRINVHNNFQVTIKRALDIFFAFLGLLGTAILLPFIYLAIKFTTGGNVFYSQKRAGQFGKVFTIHKFCTMRSDAESDGIKWACQNDSRITPIGNFLRKTRLDELPQFWNVLKGEMSFVGPRPERPELMLEIEKEVPFFSFRQWVKPGITGFAQIKYRYGASVEDAAEKLKYDLFYIKNWSILLDFQVILRTLSSIMKGSR